MKKVILFLVVAISLMACEGPMGPAGFDGRDGKDAGITWVNKTFTIQPNEWKLVGKPGELESYFVVEKKILELTEDIYREGAVIAYFQADNGIKNGMPYVQHRGEADDNGKEFLWTQTYDFDYSKEWVGFYLTYSDFSTQFKPDKPVTFHIVLMW